VDPLVVTWDKFRGFTKPTTITFPKLTVLIGRNNVGKTSAYAPLLLLRQTLNARNPETSLLSRGELTDVGSFRDYVSNHSTDSRVSFRIQLPKPEWHYLGALGFEPGDIQLTFDSSDGSISRLYKYQVNGRDGSALISRTRKGPGEDSRFRFFSRVMPTIKSTGRPYREITALRRAITNEMPEGFMFEGASGLLVPREVRSDENRWRAVRSWFSAATDLYDVHNEANTALRRILDGIVYVGPLRSLPKSSYRIAAEAPRNVGRDGEFAPEMIYREKDDAARSQIDRWLQTLGYGELRFEDLGEGEYFRASTLNADGLSVNIAHSGVGLSQVLPLLVGGIMAKQGSTFIAQQPEIHLNPAQQCLTMDFLIETARTKRVIVETHSEHILLRLRRGIAEGRIEASDVAVYYVNNIRGRTSVDHIEVGDKGEISRGAWPSGFFEEQMEDSFALALAQAGIASPS